MAVVEKEPELAQASRPWTAVLHEWVTTVDHKKIGIMYVLMAIVFLVIGGCEAVLMRWQLFSPGKTLLGPTCSTSCSRSMAPRWCSSWACRF